MRLDVGCGDFSKGDINVDTKMFSCVDVVCSAEALPFKDRCFDEVVSHHVIEHCLHPDRMVKEAMRVAKRVSIVTPNIHFIGFFLHYLFRKGFLVDETEHIFAWTPFYMRNFLNRLGVKAKVQGYVSKYRVWNIQRGLFYWLIVKPLALMGWQRDIEVVIE